MTGSGYPLVEDRVQAGIMLHARAVERMVSRSEMAEVLGVSRSKVSLEVGRLIGFGLLVEGGLAESDGGRRSSLLRIPRSAGLIGCVDLGATSTDVALSTLGGEILAHRGEPADIKDGPRVVLDRARELLWRLLLDQGSAAREVVAIGVGAPGPVEQTSGLLRSPPIMPGWDGFPIRYVFADEFAAPVFVDNDVNVMALGEHRSGARGAGIRRSSKGRWASGVGSPPGTSGRRRRSGITAPWRSSGSRAGSWGGCSPPW